MDFTYVSNQLLLLSFCGPESICFAENCWDKVAHHSHVYTEHSRREHSSRLLPCYYRSSDRLMPEAQSDRSKVVVMQEGRGFCFKVFSQNPIASILFTACQHGDGSQEMAWCLSDCQSHVRKIGLLLLIWHFHILESHFSNLCTMQVPPTDTVPQIKKEKHSTQAKNRAKRKPPKGMFLSQEDVEAVSANATAATTVLRQLDMELVSIKRQVPWVGAHWRSGPPVFLIPGCHLSTSL